MRRYEYKVVPAPEKCVTPRGLERDADPAAFTVETVLNDLGVEGWEYLRTDRMTLTKSGILGHREIEREFLIFRRHPVGLAERAPVEERTAPVALLSDRPAPTIEEIRARRVRNPELLEGAKAGRRRITPRRAVSDMLREPSEVVAAE